MEMLRKTVSFEVKALSEDEHFFFFEGYGSTFDNVDLHEDVMVRGAFTDSLGKRMPKLIWQHNQDEPIGIYIAAHEDHIGLFVKGKLPKEDTFVKGRVIPQMKIGSVTDMSIGFNIPDWDKDVEIKEGIRFIKRVDLWEVSLVTIPANERANVLAMKAATTFQDLPLAAQDREWDANAAKTRVREWAGAEDGLDTPAIQRRYRDCFFWYESENPEDFASYKLPFTDIVGGRLTAIPRGIFAAAGAMSGARGGVDIPETGRPNVIRHINRYYAKMDLESPLTEGSKMKKYWEEIETKGSNLGALLRRLIREATDDDTARADIISRMASAAGISENTVGSIVSGDIDCPPLNRLQGIARALNVGVGTIRAAAERDGCEYGEQRSAEGCGCIKAEAADYIKSDTSPKAFRLEALKGINERTLEGLLKKGVSFSGNIAKALVRVIKESDLREAVKDSHREGDIDWDKVLEKLDETTKSIKTEEH